MDEKEKPADAQAEAGADEGVTAATTETGEPVEIGMAP